MIRLAPRAAGRVPEARDPAAAGGQLATKGHDVQQTISLPTIGAYCRERRGFIGALALLSCALAALGIVADAYRAADSVTGVVQAYGSAGAVMAAAVTYALQLFAIGFALGYLWSLPPRTTHKDRADKRWDRKLFLIAAFAIFFAWLPWIVAHYPGTMRDDTFAQALQWYGIVPYYTQHPVTDTVVFGAFWSLGDLLGSRAAGLFCYIVVQALATALTFAAVVAYLDRIGAPRTLVVGAVAFYALARVIYQPVDTMSKDALNGIPFTLLCLLLFEAVRTNLAALRRRGFFITFVLALALAAVTKRTMLYVALLAIVIIAAVRLARHRHVALLLAGTAASCVLALGIWTPAVNRAVGANANPTYEMYSIPVQQIVRTIREHPNALDTQDRATLGTFIDIDRACRVYNPWRSDEATGCIVDGSRFPTCVGIWLSLGVEHPASYAAATMNMVATWFSLDTPIDYGHDAQAELFSPDRMEAWMSFFDSREELDGFVESLGMAPRGEVAMLRDALESLDARQRDMDIVASYGLWCIALPLITATYCLCTYGRRNLRYLSYSAVPFALMASLLVGPIALYWYSIPSVYICPLVIGVPAAMTEVWRRDTSGERVRE